MSSHAESPNIYIANTLAGSGLFKHCGSGSGLAPQLAHLAAGEAVHAGTGMKVVGSVLGPRAFSRVCGVCAFSPRLRGFSADSGFVPQSKNMRVRGIQQFVWRCVCECWMVPPGPWRLTPPPASGSAGAPPPTTVLHPTSTVNLSATFGCSRCWQIGALSAAPPAGTLIHPHQQAASAVSLHFLHAEGGGLRNEAAGESVERCILEVSMKSSFYV